MSMMEREYAPSQIHIDESTGEKWRLCAGAAVLNSQNKLLVGKRIGNFDTPQWQGPQGGVDDAYTPKGESKEKPKESILEACNRELYEEMGLQVGKHVMVDDVLSNNDRGGGGIRYQTTGTNSWLTKSGFAGQELYWTVYRCIHGRGDYDPTTMCDLSGLNGENPEFSSVEWQSIDDVVNNIWEKKREPYMALKNQILGNGGGGGDNKSKESKCKSSWDEKIYSLDFTGTWTRDNDHCVDVIDGLIKRGISLEDATKEASKPYIQTFERIIDNSAEPGSWLVTTYGVDGKTVRRKLQYRVGEWKEEYNGNAVLFGSSSSNEGEGSTTATTTTTLVRRTSYVAEPDSQQTVAHVTITHGGPRGGIEESRRYLKQGKMILRRTYWPHKDDERTKTDDPIVSTEVFSRIVDDE